MERKAGVDHIHSFFKKMVEIGLFWFVFVLHNANTKIAQISLLVTLTRGGSMEGANKSTELWRHPLFHSFTIKY